VAGVTLMGCGVAAAICVVGGFGARGEFPLDGGGGACYSGADT
jgi:hypothetical protein